MRYRVLGRSGLKVSEICLGTMTFGEDWGFGASQEESRKQFDLFAEAGGNFIDTANVYTKGTSERFVGEFVKSDRDKFVVATKYSIATRFDDINAWGNSRKNLVQSVDASLSRLDRAVQRVDGLSGPIGFCWRIRAAPAGLRALHIDGPSGYPSEIHVDHGGFPCRSSRSRSARSRS